MMRLKKVIAFVAVCTFFFGSDSCTLLNPDTCETTDCQNGGICVSGNCNCPPLFAGDYCEVGKDQVWELAFWDVGVTPHDQFVKVLVKGFVNSGTFSETTDSSGLWMYDGAGNKCYRLPVGGNIVKDSHGDRWSFVGMTGAGCGLQTTGSNSSAMTNANFPYATGITNGRVMLTTQSPFGTTSGQVTWVAMKLDD
jgi:hypothetical protein